MRIYIESTIPSYIVARPARDLIQSARQEMTRDWWNLKRHKHELFTSQVTLDEIAEGEEAMAQRRLEIIADVPVLDLTQDVATLTRHILSSGLLPTKADSDAAAHIRSGYCSSDGYITDVELLPKHTPTLLQSKSAVRRRFRRGDMNAGGLHVCG